MLRITLLAMIALGGCSDTANDPETGSQSHWLSVCDGDASCPDALSCVCGVCTLTCESEISCQASPETSRCALGAEVPEGLCTGQGTAVPNGICLPACSSDADCDGDGVACVAGSCVPVPEDCPQGDQCPPGYTTVLSLEADGCINRQCLTSALSCGAAGDCEWPQQYCDVFSPGQPEAETEYECLAMPNACVPDPTCNCLTVEEPGKECSEDDSGVTLTLSAP
jgi:hypothetical protein